MQIFTSDPGDHLGDHRLQFKGAEPYDTLTHVPFIWFDPASAETKAPLVEPLVEMEIAVSDRVPLPTAQASFIACGLSLETTRIAFRSLRSRQR